MPFIWSFFRPPYRHHRRALIVTMLLAVTAAPALVADERPLTLTDLMKFRQIEDPVISRDGRFVAYALEPDRGDGEAVVKATQGTAEFRIERGTRPELSADGRWAAAAVAPAFAEREKAKDEEAKKKLKNALALVDLRSGDETRFEDIESFAFSGDGRWLAMQRYEEEEEDGADEAEEGEAEEGEAEAAAGEEKSGEEQPAEEEADEEAAEEKLGTTLVLRHAADGTEIEIPYVADWAFESSGAYLAYAVAAPGGTDNGLFLRRLGDGEAPAEALAEEERGHYSHLTWTSRRAAVSPGRLAFLAAMLDEDGEPGEAELRTWDGDEVRRVASGAEAPEGFALPAEDNELTWSRDARRLFFGFRPRDLMAKDEDDDESDAAEDAEFDPFDTEAILEGRGVDVWHWDDPLIVTHQKEAWEDEKKRLYLAVAHLGAEGVGASRVVPLADHEVREVVPAENPRAVLAFADTPHLKELTWNWTLHDLYLVDLESGERRPVTTRLYEEDSAVLSPGGRFVAFYEKGDWHLFDSLSDERRNLTAGLEFPFANEDHDYPLPAPGYGEPLWLEDESAVLVYDKYDVWLFPTAGGEATPRRLSAGREKEVTFRVVDLEPEEEAVAPGPLLLHAYHQKRKDEAFHVGTTEAGEPATREWLATGKHRFRPVGRAEEAPLLVYSRENYREFPDLWASPLELDGKGNGSSPHRLTDANPQVSEFAWGEAELVEFSSLDGEPLQGVLIKPGNYRPGERYPVLVYYYRFFSQRLHEFNEPVVNHRPSFPFYASNGYAVFLPDIRFEIGRPGFSATKSLVPGVQKLIDMGIADPDAIGLHGHSWSGYQTAFVITQTDLFAAAVAGAPVSNMTSAYGGIRWGSGLARQFQYEQSQSRIGGSLWEYPERYIENSPLFFADRIETPLLIQFGDEDGAVPWTQGIELYLAMRRLGKECVFLQYRGEPHHLRKYANKLDYSIKMKEFFDHHLRGAPAPEWWREGLPYRGE